MRFATERPETDLVADGSQTVVEITMNVRISGCWAGGGDQSGLVGLVVGVFE